MKKMIVMQVENKTEDSRLPMKKRIDALNRIAEKRAALMEKDGWTLAGTARDKQKELCLLLFFTRDEETLPS